jgi:hypothetical protein
MLLVKRLQYTSLQQFNSLPLFLQVKTHNLPSAGGMGQLCSAKVTALFHDIERPLTH